MSTFALECLFKVQMKPRAFVFDAYGTLFDIHSSVLRNGRNIPGDCEAVVEGLPQESSVPSRRDRIGTSLSSEASLHL